MSVKRKILRKEALKMYKEQTKGIPKNRRLSFVEFYKQYKNLKNKDGMNESRTPDIADFDFDNIVNVNEINDNTETSKDKEEVQ